MTIAERFLDRYDTDDFKGDYALHLLEDGDACHTRIKELFQQGWKMDDKYGDNLWLTDAQAHEVLDYIKEHIDEFMTSMNSHYVGYASIDSVSFGEQEEQLTGLTNHRTGKDYTLPYLRKVFDEAGYVVNGNYAYHDLSGSGLHICLKHGDLTELVSKFRQSEVV
jgi:hypothetical protein